MINQSPIRSVKSFSSSRMLSGIYSVRMDQTEQRYVMKFLFMYGRKYKAIHTEHVEFSRDMPSRLMFANIGVESSKLATFRWMTG
jgi:hypothetical protein